MKKMYAARSICCRKIFETTLPCGFCTVATSFEDLATAKGPGNIIFVISLRYTSMTIFYPLLEAAPANLVLKSIEFMMIKMTLCLFQYSALMRKS